MQFTRTFCILFAIALTAACSEAPTASATSGQAEVDEYVENPETGLPVNPSKRRLADSVKIISGTDPNFGIELSSLTSDQASIVESAWTNYKRILSGGHPDCAEAPFAPSDGGTRIYFCDGYDIARVQSLAGTIESPGYDYGPSLNFLNGQHVERLKFYSQEEMAQLERASR